MPKRAATVTLLDVTFTRTSVPNQTVVTHITYVMEKRTPFGPMKAQGTVDYMTFINEGAAKTDGMMYAELTAKLNEEEANLLLEGCANLNFGEAEVSVA